MNARLKTVVRGTEYTAASLVFLVGGALVAGTNITAPIHEFGHLFFAIITGGNGFIYSWNETFAGGSTPFSNFMIEIGGYLFDGLFFLALGFLLWIKWRSPLTFFSLGFWLGNAYEAVPSADWRDARVSTAVTAAVAIMVAFLYIVLLAEYAINAEKLKRRAKARRLARKAVRDGLAVKKSRPPKPISKNYAGIGKNKYMSSLTDRT